MAMDLRQIMGAILTFSMFVMLLNMIKRDHFDADVLLEVPATATIQHEVSKVSRQSKAQIWNDHELLNPCWNNSTLTSQWRESKGYITFSLSGGPEYHVSQIANAVLISKHLGATLVLPDIIGSKGHKRVFGEIYDADKFVTTMNGVIHVEKFKPLEVTTRKLVTIRVPYMATENYIITNIEPLLRKSGNIRVITYFPSLTMRSNKKMNPYSCMAMFEAIRLQPKLQEIVEFAVGRLRSHDEADGQFVSVYFKGECREINYRIKGMKSCYNLVEIGEFLRKIGLQKDAIIYVTQSRGDARLGAFKELYPNTFTKENILEESEKEEILKSKDKEMEEAIDFEICSESDVFVAAKSGMFYSRVVGNRIANGKAQVLVPAHKTSTSPNDYISSYISKKTHPAYSCFC